jgi:predicted small lipoprotein YifL
MSMKHLAAAGLVAVAAAILTGCGSAAPAEVPPATVTQIAGSQVARLQLTGQAIQRLGITTQPVREAPAAKSKVLARTGARKVIPYSAVVYDTDGSTWTYVNTATRTYVRQPITIAAIQGNVAVLSAGPPVGTKVVTVGAAELLGTEYDISGEE